MRRRYDRESGTKCMYPREDTVWTPRIRIKDTREVISIVIHTSRGCVSMMKKTSPMKNDKTPDSITRAYMNLCRFHRAIRLPATSIRVTWR